MNTVEYCQDLEDVKHNRVKEIIRDYLDVGVGPGPPLEIEYVSTVTGRTLGYWAYGYYLPDYPYPGEDEHAKSEKTELPD